MNRKQKIIVSITGIFIVLLALVGLTYAYFLTQITGNSNDKSISVTTANLELVYGDGNGVLSPAEAIVPGNQIKFLDAENNVVNSKTFSVTNNGEDTEYVVFIDNVSVTYASDVGETIKQGDPATFESNDFRFTLTCTIESADSTRNNTSCNSVTDGVFPLKDKSIVVGNNIAKGDKHNYTLTMEYIETNINQSDDMNKSLSALINIEDTNRINPYSENKISLAYNIINNAINNINGTELMSTPLSKIGENAKVWEEVVGKETKLYENYYEYWWEEAEFGETKEEAITQPKSVLYTFMEEYEESPKKACEAVMGKHISLYESYDSITNTDIFDYIGKVIDCADDGTPYVEEEITETRYEKVLSTTIDDYGTSYYYRGKVEDNYVNFAGMCWRILRIQGDGSVKLILDDKNTTCDDDEDTDGDGTADYAYSRNARIGDYGYYGSESVTINGVSVNIPNYLEPEVNAEKSMVKTFYDFQTTGKLKNYIGSLKAGGWCLNDTNIDYNGQKLDLLSAYKVALNEQAYFYYPSPSTGFLCPGRIINKFKTVSNVSDETDMYVATVTKEEMLYTGITYDASGYGADYSFLGGGSIYNTTLSLDMTEMYEPNIYTYVWLNDNGLVSNENGWGAIPVISLREGIELAANSGNGLRTSPYVIE